MRHQSEITIEKPGITRAYDDETHSEKVIKGMGVGEAFDALPVPPHVDDEVERVTADELILMVEHFPLLDTECGLPLRVAVDVGLSPSTCC